VGRPRSLVTPWPVQRGNVDNLKLLRHVYPVDVGVHWEVGKAASAPELEGQAEDVLNLVPSWRGGNKDLGAAGKRHAAARGGGSAGVAQVMRLIADHDSPSELNPGKPNVELADINQFPIALGGLHEHAGTMTLAVMMVCWAQDDWRPWTGALPVFHAAWMGSSICG